jgi:hypothetical protein
MMRTFLTSMLLLMMAIGGMLFWQWNVYSKKEGSPVQEKKLLSEQVLIMSDENRALNIKHTIKKIQKGSYKLLNPLNVDIKCENPKACEITTDGQLLVKKYSSEVTFRYSIPFASNARAFLLQNWAIQLNGIEMGKTRVELTLKFNRKGDWGAGGQLIGKTKKEYINYYVFQNDGPIFPIYHQVNELAYNKISDKIHVYYDTSIPFERDKLEKVLTDLPQFSSATVILTNQHKEVMDDTFMILPAMPNYQALSEKLFVRHIEKIFPFKNKNEKWLQSVLANVMYNKSFGGEKVKLLTATLRKELGANGIETFADTVKNMKKPLSAVSLDDAFSKVKGLKTHFFSQNHRENTPFYPLRYEDNRKILVNRNVIKDGLIYFENKRLYPFQQVVTMLDYEYSVIDQNQILLSKNDNLLRFFLNENVFIYNEEDYGVRTNPLTKIGNKIYIEEEWLQDLFGVTIKNQADTILIEET